MNGFTYFMLCIAAFWPVWLVAMLTAVFFAVMENCPQAEEALLRTVGKLFHIDFNVDSDEM